MGDTWRGTFPLWSVSDAIEGIPENGPKNRIRPEGNQLPALCLLLGSSLVAADAPPLVKAGFDVYNGKGIPAVLDF